jgi:hypothetical protein
MGKNVHKTAIEWADTAIKQIEEHKREGEN